MTQAVQKTQSSLIDPKSEEIVEINEIVNNYGLVASDGTNAISDAIRTANGLALLNAALTPEIMRGFMALQGSSLGFKTDREYDEKTVKTCIIEASLKGVLPFGNQFNILAGNCYITKEGMGHLLSKIPGLRYMLTPGIPKFTENGAEVKVGIQWSYKGEKSQQDVSFAIRVNKGMGTDAVLGKAERKARSWLYRYITGMEIGDGDINDVGTTSSSTPLDVTPKRGRFTKSSSAPDSSAAQANDIDITATETSSSGDGMTDIERQHPVLYKALADANCGVTVQNIMDWYKENNWVFQSDEIFIKFMDSAIPQYKEMHPNFNN